ncbi:hypothetical protein DM02DRAFT_60209 [Periconia macrospinosa]|uniref:Uncharacterized protein n=1 Tax=Periconia macrospinosa TaxID=97972 RepID=A0A2V1DKH5_9PLEO|nr:hypothetical protein DM02DRAFT_60209 [Periconia macrospinosa]
MSALRSEPCITNISFSFFFFSPSPVPSRFSFLVLFAASLSTVYFNHAPNHRSVSSHDHHGLQSSTITFSSCLSILQPLCVFPSVFPSPFVSSRTDGNHRDLVQLSAPYGWDLVGWN